MRELAYRQMILQTYDIHETGVTEDNIDGGIIVNGSWLNIAHPLPLRWMLTAIGVATGGTWREPREPYRPLQRGCGLRHLRRRAN